MKYLSVFAAFVLAMLLAADAGITQPAALTAATLERWLAAYGDAWETRDADAAAMLFAADATYAETPYATPYQGRGGIRDYWSTVTADQRDIEFEAEVLAIDDRTGVAKWSATFVSASTGQPVGLDGVFVLQFDADGLCTALREWWFLRPDE